MSKKTFEDTPSMRFFYRDGELGRISLTVIDSYPATHHVRIDDAGIRKVIIPYRTNAHGVEYFDWRGTRFYADGAMMGKGVRHA